MPTAQYPKPESDVTKPKNRPAAEFRDTNLRVTIWPSVGKDGVTRHNVIISRSYQSNGIWKETQYLGRLDLQRAIKLLNRADDWIFNTAARTREIESQAA